MERTSNVTTKPAGSGSYIVQPGDGLESISYTHGLFWKTVWEHAQNEDLRQKRKDPHVLLPGDKLFIPELRTEQIAGGTEKKHRFRRKGVPAKFKLQLRRQGKPRANLDYELKIDGEIRRGKTNTQGWIIEAIPPDAKQGELRLDHGKEIHLLELGFLDPIETIPGQKMRLRNLGYYSGPMDDAVTTSFKEALGRFQVKHNLDPTKEADAATVDKLKNIHGS